MLRFDACAEKYKVMAMPSIAFGDAVGAGPVIAVFLSQYGFLAQVLSSTHAASHTKPYQQNAEG